LGGSEVAQPPGDRERLAAALKQLRLRSGLSGEALGKALGWSQSKVSKLENGARSASPDDVAGWMSVTGAQIEQREELAALAESAANRVTSWWQSHAQGIAARQGEIAEAEARSERIMNFHPLMIPTLLQTAAVARRIMELVAEVTGRQDDVPAATAARMQRQAVLYDPAKRIDFVITEASLRWRLSDDPSIMAAQADRILSVDTLPNVSVTVLPVDVTVPVLPYSGFGIFEVPDEPFAVVEALNSELIVTGERDLAIYRTAFARLQQAGVTGTEAHAILRAIALPE
jgi:transcriptional regulator with XRE-family HTH domain